MPMPDILLIPTELERRVVQVYLRQRLKNLADPTTIPLASYRIEKCGFGLIAAAACTASAIALHRPSQVLLLGIAGTYDRSIPIGSACCVDRVTCHGIGIGDSLSSAHRSASELGWAHCDATVQHSAISDTLVLPFDRHSHQEPARHLISVTTASADESEASKRRERFPDASMEDMEGFAVALACAVAKVPLRIIRGVANFAGDRNHSNWAIEPALRAAMEMAVDSMGVSR